MRARESAVRLPKPILNAADGLSDVRGRSPNICIPTIATLSWTSATRKQSAQSQEIKVRKRTEKEQAFDASGEAGEV